MKEVLICRRIFEIAVQNNKYCKSHLKCDTCILSEHYIYLVVLELLGKVIL